MFIPPSLSMPAILGGACSSCPEVIQPPAEFSWYPYSIYRDGSGTWGTTYDHDAAKPNAGTTYYVSSTTGTGGNSGLSPSVPLNTITAALAKPDCGEIVLADGRYDRNRFPASLQTLARDLAIRAADGATVYFGAGDQNVVWTQNVTYPTVYQRTRTGIAGVYDETELDADGDWTKQALVASVAAVAALPGSYYIDGSNVLYVHTWDSRQPDNQYHVFISTTYFLFQGQYKIWFDNINFVGLQAIGMQNISSTEFVTVHQRNCTFKYMPKAANSVVYTGVDVYSENCVVAKNGKDGFNYHDRNGRVCHVLEYGCLGLYANGSDGEGNNNGSTSHDGGSVIRIGCRAWENDGPNLIDSGVGASSLLLGCYAADSVKVAQKVNYTFTEGKAWLADCESAGTRDYDLTAEEGAVVRYVSSDTYVVQELTGGTITKVTSLGELFS